MLENKSHKIAGKYFQRAFNSQMNGDFILARQNYLTSIEIHPTVEALVNLGWTYSKENNYEEAIKQCHKALVLDQNYGMAYSDIGYYLLKSKKIDEAIIWFEEAIAQNDFEGKFFTFYNLGRAYEQKGMWLKGIEMYDKSISIKPGFKLGMKKLILLSTKLN
ncbi:MAG: tetratricopeptide repeat protein [Bacteroidetes bacterium]|nr:tetratricopeptide repeat protein [Bacteroidota bacterium]MBU1116031.1 tetratricopeptide repeat protein [Bacteroidota bacterium]MBU1799201.1 tetratricopeptide repeat protein [Bacteroidota bacterium]